MARNSKAETVEQPVAFTKAAEIAGLADGTSCLGRCVDDEPVFVLRARDVQAASTIRTWAQAVEHRGAPRAKVQQAYEMAQAFDRWREAHGGGKVPD